MTAGEITVDSTGEEILDNARGATEFSIRCDSGSTQRALVNVEGLHDDGEFFVVAKGVTAVFKLAPCGIRKVFVKGEGGSATVQYGIVSRTA